MKINKIIYTIFFLFLFLIGVISCKSIPERPDTLVEEKKSTYRLDPGIEQWVEAKIDSLMITNQIPALSIGIVKDGELAYSRGFGLMERGSDKKVTEHSLYQIGSDTKKLTGIIARNLVSEGKLELEKSIIDYFLNEALTVAAREKLKQITINDLLLHRSGIPNRAPGNKRIDGDPHAYSVYGAGPD